MHPDNRQQPARLNVRLDDELRSRIETAAQASRRSMNAEICHRIEQAFNGMTTVAALNRALAMGDSAAPTPPAGAVKPTLETAHHNGEPTKSL
jgi:Arc-like DNA binding domain